MREPDTAHEPLDTAGIASAEDGHVLLDGPDGVAITLTPKAAIDTAASLLRAAEEALTHVPR